MPKNLVSETGVINLLSLTVFTSNVGLFFALNRMYCVFSIFMEGEFIINQVLTLLYIVIVISFNSAWLQPFSIRLVSSANNIGVTFLFTIFCKSLMCTRNSKGPKTDPWGTPSVIFTQLEYCWYGHLYDLYTTVMSSKLLKVCDI